MEYMQENNRRHWIVSAQTRFFVIFKIAMEDYIFLF